ncbi:putative arylformamidase [Rosa chinensis]|uniref:Putative arylformamidase n=1 Tax=Rosa chinensis TaxID=74649 RepID=A0A2P6PLY8_ROSCH|nr:cyclase-like protein 2 [Rosa chinensis]PRQ22926.1 putative arylformamidase [Rosa chinensis]
MKTLLFLLLLCFLSLTHPTLSDATSAYPSVPGTAPADCSFSDGHEAHDTAPLIPPRREVYGNGRIFDITHLITTATPSYGSPDGVLGQFLWFPHRKKNGSIASVFKLPSHTGTHVDSPGHYFHHYLDAGFDVDTLDLEVLNGPALLVDVPRDKNITAEVMKSLNIPKGVRHVLFRTLNTDRRLMFKNQFDPSYVGFMKDGAKWLVENTDIKLVGIDYLSAAAFDDLIPSHLVFLESREIILVEALKLDDIQPGIYSVHCLPLRLQGAEGSPIRCILIK